MFSKIDPRNIAIHYPKSSKYRSWKFLGSGWDRTAFKVGRHVVKFPNHKPGVSCNQDEALNWFASRKYVCPTRVIIIGNRLCVVQPYLTSPGTEYIAPEWAGFYDCAQGGLDRYGSFKIFDFASEGFSSRSEVIGYYD